MSQPFPLMEVMNETMAMMAEAAGGEAVYAPHRLLQVRSRDAQQPRAVLQRHHRALAA